MRGVLALSLTTVLCHSLAGCMAWLESSDPAVADDPGPMACGDAGVFDPRLAALHQAEQALATAPHDPATSLDVVNPDRGVCAIRGGGGLFFARVDVHSRFECQASCASFPNANRTCTWKGIVFQGDPQLACLVVSGAGLTLSALTAATASQCATACNAFQSDAYRSCDWGTERFFHPPRGSECRILNGAGVNALIPIRFGSQADCQAACDARASDPYRRCLYGNLALKAPDPAARCELLGGAGAVLAPVFYASQSDCIARCAGVTTTHPNRVCYYGATRLP